MNTKNARVLLYLSYATGAPIVAGLAFISFALLESASLFHALASIIFATVLPIFSIINYAKRDNVNYNIPERNFRLKPIAFAIVGYMLGFLILFVLKAPVLMTCMMFAYLINTSAMFMITLFWKISFHTAGVTGPLTFIVYVLGCYWSVLYLLAIPVGYIRFLMKEHSVPQLVVGAILSAALSWLQLIFILPVFNIIL